MKKLLLALCCCLALNASAQFGGFRLPSIISHHAVMQQNSKVKLWGWAQSGNTVKIVCSWNATDTLIAEPGKEWTWETTVKTPKAGGPYTITFICLKRKTVINDILMGEVWLCSGQSNMEYSFNSGPTDVGDAVATSANNELRFFQLSHKYNAYPQTDVEGEWKISSPQTVANMSVVGYFFGKKINETTKSPVGLIASYWGGSNVQSWIPPTVFDKDAELKKSADNMTAVNWVPMASSVIYNAMIHPFINYRIAGTIWYQAEGNTEHPEFYEKLFSTLIKSWREAFQTDFPFYYVQIAPWKGYAGLSGALVREQQERALKVPKTGMISVGDLVNDITDIHPKIKKEVANRLVNMALKEQYGITDLQPYFPHFKSFVVKTDKAIVTFSSLGKLTCKDKVINSFQLAGIDKVFYPASAVIEKDGSITLTNKLVKTPVAVRYCFTNDGVPNLFDTNGLPLIPFRTDNW